MDRKPVRRSLFAPLLGPLAAGAGVLCLCASAGWLAGWLASGSGRSAWGIVSVLGAAALGGFLLLWLTRLDWGRLFREPREEGARRLRVQARFGPAAIPVPIGRHGTVAVEGDEVVLRTRDYHVWILLGSYAAAFLRSFPSPRSDAPAFFMLFGICIYLLMLLRTVERRIPLSSVRLALAEDRRLTLYHALERWGSRTTLLLGPGECRALRDLLAGRLPMEVLPPPARRPVSPRSPAPPASPRIPALPRTAIDARKVAELDRALRGLDGMR